MLLTGAPSLLLSVVALSALYACATSIASCCVGAVIVNHTSMTSNFAGGDAMFAATDSGDWIIGHVPNGTTATSLGVRDLITGFGWLVRDGKVAPGPGGEQAPRTSVGVDSSVGRMLLGLGYMAAGYHKD